MKENNVERRHEQDLLIIWTYRPSVFGSITAIASVHPSRFQLASRSRSTGVVAVGVHPAAFYNIVFLVPVLYISLFLKVSSQLRCYRAPCARYGRLLRQSGIVGGASWRPCRSPSISSSGVHAYMMMMIRWLLLYTRRTGGQAWARAACSSEGGDARQDLLSYVVVVHQWVAPLQKLLLAGSLCYWSAVVLLLAGGNAQHAPRACFFWTQWRAWYPRSLPLSRPDALHHFIYMVGFSRYRWQQRPSLT